MPKYLIERNVPGAGDLPISQLREVSQKSCAILSEMGPQIQWVHSYVTGNKLYCIYIAPSADEVREHARQGGFPADSVEEITMTIDPTTGEG